MPCSALRCIVMPCDAGDCICWQQVRRALPIGRWPSAGRVATPCLNSAGTFWLRFAKMNIKMHNCTIDGTFAMYVGRYSGRASVLVWQGYNHDHRLSRWFVLALEGPVTCHILRCIEKSTNRTTFSTNLKGYLFFLPVNGSYVLFHC